MTNKKNNIVLIGFMGSGKSKVGALLAQDLGFSLIDMDALIEKTEGKSIADIFRIHGESSFRALELACAVALKHTRNAVIVCGGGAPTFFECHQALKDLGHIFFLDANFPLIESRLAGSNKRPLALAPHATDRAQLLDRFTFRRPIFRSLGHVINVDHQDLKKTVQEICARFLALQELATVPKLEVCDERRPYPIFIERGAFGFTKTIAASLGLSSSKPVLITSAPLATVFARSIVLLAHDFTDLTVITIDDGETAKNLNSVNHIYEQLFVNRCHRNTLVLSLGGGVVGDVAGFAAATYMRGLPIIHIPTTLLAMVDSSVGGKTGVDTAFGKNLLGAFHNPRAVIVDPAFLSSLPEDETACGMAEIIKAAIIADPGLFHQLLDQDLELEEIITRAVKVKATIVGFDPEEASLRAHLNLGHTFAHAIEQVSGFSIKHGHAVAIGLVLATKLAERLGLCTESFLNKLLALLEKYHLPKSLPLNLATDALISAMALDKKRDSRGLKFILPIKLGHVMTTYVEETELREFLQSQA